jgi:phosphoribosylformylglycinamidine synthase
MKEACEALGTPVTGGNVSLYNENPTGAVYPTPVIGMVGLVDSLAHVTRSAFTTPGDAIVLLGENTDELGGSEYLAHIHGVVAGRPPRCDLGRERAVVEALLDAIRSGAVRSAHDCAEGGLAVALAECVMMDRARPASARVDLSAWRDTPRRALLFGEAQARIVVSTPDPAAVLAIAERHGAPARAIGEVRPASEAFTIAVEGGDLSASVAALAEAYHEAIPRIMSRTASAQDVALASDSQV